MLIDIIDNFTYIFENYGYLVFLSIFILKIIVLFWYQPTKYKFYFKGFFVLYADTMSSRKYLNKAKWPLFKRTHNTLTAIMYFVLLFWGVIYLVLNFAK